MQTRTYSDPSKAYTLMNSWTQIKTMYEVQFQDKDVTHVNIMFEGEQPRFATVFYKTETRRGLKNIDLTTKILLEKPSQPPSNLEEVLKFKPVK